MNFNRLGLRLNTLITYQKYLFFYLNQQVMMLLVSAAHMQWFEALNLIVKGMEGAIAAKTVTYDFERLMKALSC